MGKFTQTAYTGASTASIAREIVNQAGLDRLHGPAGHYDELNARRSVDHPHKVLITITVERIRTTPRVATAKEMHAIGVELGIRKPKRAVKPNPELGRALNSLLKGARK